MLLKHTINPKALTAIYGTDEPSLSNAILYKVELDVNSPEVVLRFDLEQFPSNPPDKWIANCYNTAQASLMLMEVSYVSIKGWAGHNKVNIEIKEINELLSLSAIGDTCHIRIVFRLMDVSISGYANQLP